MSPTRYTDRVGMPSELSPAPSPRRGDNQRESPGRRTSTAPAAFPAAAGSLPFTIDADGLDTTALGVTALDTEVVSTPSPAAVVPAAP
eukprot:scaffold119973_cov20-Phaeocystis_antarctica.AAC.1